MVSINVKYINNSIDKFIDSLEKKSKASVLHALYELHYLGNELTLPLSKYIGQRMFELRITNPENIRIIYIFYKDQAWVLNIFKKKSNKIPKKEIELSLQRLKMFLD